MRNQKQFVSKMVEIKDYRGAGDLVVDQVEPSLFVIWGEMVDIGGADWEELDQAKTLVEAMTKVAELVKLNVENDFYE